MKRVLVIVFSFCVISVTAQITIPAYTTVTWDPNTLPAITGDITLEEGATLNINPGCTLSMPSNAKILVKKNAQLFVHDSQITGNWLGIRCDKGTMSVTDRIPYVNISGSEISGAEIAFINAPDDYSVVCGGSIVANYTDFKDNYIFIILKNYVFNQKSLEIAVFNKCKFRETYHCHISAKFIYLENVDNVSFKGCEFSYSCASPRTCIYAIDSKISITCSETFFPHQITNNAFYGFDKVIVINNSPICLTKPVTIAQCEFYPDPNNPYNTNQKCIYLTGCLNPQVYSNEFNIVQGNNTWVGGLQKKSAIELNECYAFSVQDNEINYSGAEQNTYGIVINNSLDKTNSLYRNTINQAEVGIQAIGKNRKNTQDPNEPNLGLKFLCNTITSFDAAYYIDVCEGNTPSGVIGVSRFQQGALAGNAFSPNFNSLYPRTLSGNPPPENDFRNIPTGNADVIYMTPYDATPQYYGIQYKTTNVFTNYDQNTSKNSPHCESRIPCFGPYCPVQGPYPKTTLFPQFQSAKNQLDELVNGGDYEALLELVGGVDQNNVESIYDVLMSSTPSTDILAMACGNDLFTTSMVTSLLVENSYGIKSNIVRDALEIRNNSLVSSQMDEIHAAAETISEYEELLMEIEQMVMEYSDYMNRDLYYLANRDSIPMDSIREYLAAYDDFLSIAQLIHLEFSEGYVNEAYNWYDSLQRFSNNPDQLEAYNTLFDEILADVYVNLGGDFTLITESQIETLSGLTEGSTYAAGYAKYILTRYFSQNFESSACPVSRYSQRIKPDIVENADSNTLEVYPNPARHWITIEINGNENALSSIEIFDLTGKRVLKKEIESQIAQIDVSLLNKGYYIIKVVSGDGVLSRPLILD
jgi:hypothetical protein